MQERAAGRGSIRPFRPGDADEVRRIVREVFDEYGFVFEPSGYDRDLTMIDARYAPPGAFWTLDEDGRVAGCVGASDEGEGTVELHRLYIDPAVRGQGYGRRLARHVVAWARERGARRVVLWSDVRLGHAHALYEAEGFVRRGTRVCEDVQRSREYEFELDL